MTVSTLGAGPENQIAAPGETFKVVLVFLDLTVVGFTIGSLTKAMVEFDLGSFFSAAPHGKGNLHSEGSFHHDG